VIECVGCKTRVEEKTKFCPECGKQIPKIEIAPENKTKGILFATLEQISDILQISKPTTYKLIENDNLPWFPIGRDKRFIVPEVLRWAINRQVQSGRKQA
jgi:predicted DNA-binding transcriptional regulator AlpA